MKQYLGKGDLGTIVAAHNFFLKNGDENVEGRCKFLINWDGTIMPEKAERWKGLVLGANKNGDVTLTNHCNKEERIQLSKETLKSMPITGFVQPKTQAFPMLLRGNGHGSRAVVLSSNSGTWQGNDWYDMIIGDTKDAVNVHFEQKF